MYTIQNVFAREVLDSRGNPTIEVDLTLLSWHMGRSIVPSGASTGIHEALELRDGDNSRYLGKWVLTAVNNVNTTIKSAIEGKSFEEVRELDKLMITLDGTKNKTVLGANAILWVSMAFIGAVTKANNKWLYEYINKGEWHILPYPMMNILNWGSHADNNIDVQEFMIVPVGAANIHEAVRMGAEVFHTLKKILKGKGLVTSVGDEWWYAPNLGSNEEALQVIVQAIQQAGYTTEQIKIALDAASSEFFKDGKYVLAGENKTFTSAEIVDFYADWVERYPIMSIEDGMAEDDFEGWKLMNEKLWNKIMIVWDDLFVTNIERLKIGIDQKLANAILIKLNQIGSVSETIDCIRMAYENWMRVVISHRSGETEDTFIADLSVAMNTGFIKTGSASRTDRVAKYNQLMRIEENLWDNAKYGK